MPFGFTNDYTYGIGVPDNMGAALRNIFSGIAREIDICNFDGNMLVCIIWGWLYYGRRGAEEYNYADFGVLQVLKMVYS